MLENSSKLIVKTLERHQWYRSGVSTVSFEQISHIFIVDFEKVNDIWGAWNNRNLVGCFKRKYFCELLKSNKKKPPIPW